MYRELRTRASFRFLPLLAMLVASACGGDGHQSVQELPDRGEDLLVVYRPKGTVEARLDPEGLMPADPSSQDIEGSQDERTFYLAIHKSQLNKKWCLSAYMKQFVPGAAGSFAARSVGMRIVTFKVQNDRLFVVSADDRERLSDTFDAEVLVDAYDLVNGYSPFTDLVGSRDYVVFDPATGTHNLVVSSDSAVSVGSGSNLARVSVDLAYSQNFRRLKSGIAYEKVFAGQVALEPDRGSGAVGMRIIPVAGTLGIGLKPYQEADGFAAAPPGRYFFQGTPQGTVPVGETRDRYSTKWHIQPGMAPIIWHLSTSLLNPPPDVPLQGSDLLLAAKQGVEAWNKAFGFTAIQAIVGSVDEAFGVEGRNFLVADWRPTSDSSFADFHWDPSDGRIVGASVYLSLGIFRGLGGSGDEPVDGPSGPIATSADPYGTTTADGAPPLKLTWSPLQSNGHTEVRSLAGIRLNEDTGYVAAESSEELPEYGFQKYLLRLVTHLVTHEIGHTLGLRHNFKGSLTPPVSDSIMDYVPWSLAAHVIEPQRYDVDAVRYLYGLSQSEPTRPFCTDFEVGFDPDCQKYDRASEPLSEFHAHQWKSQIDTFARDYTWDTFPTVTPMMYYVWFGESHERVFAWNALVDGIAVPASETLIAANPYGRDDGIYALNLLVQTHLPLVYLDRTSFIDLLGWGATERYDAYRRKIGSDVAFNRRFLVQLLALLTNADGIRSFETRRVCVKILKEIQSLEALVVLNGARVVLENELMGTDDATVKLELKELISRIDQAMDPYFRS